MIISYSRKAESQIRCNRVSIGRFSALLPDVASDFFYQVREGGKSDQLAVCEQICPCAQSVVWSREIPRIVRDLRLRQVARPQDIRCSLMLVRGSDVVPLARPLRCNCHELRANPTRLTFLSDIR